MKPLHIALLIFGLAILTPACSIRPNRTTVDKILAVVSEDSGGAMRWQRADPDNFKVLQNEHGQHIITCDVAIDFLQDCNGISIPTVKKQNWKKGERLVLEDFEIKLEKSSH